MTDMPILPPFDSEFQRFLRRRPVLPHADIRVRFIDIDRQLSLSCTLVDGRMVSPAHSDVDLTVESDSMSLAYWVAGAAAVVELGRRLKFSGNMVYLAVLAGVLPEPHHASYPQAWRALRYPPAGSGP